MSGYPYVLPLSAFSSPGSCTYLSFEEKEAAFNVTNQLNGVIEDAITEMNDTGDERFEYVDPNTIDSPFKDHQLCWPDSFFIGLDNENVFRYTFHPNREGQAAFAEIFQDHLAN